MFFAIDVVAAGLDVFVVAFVVFVRFLLFVFVVIVVVVHADLVF